MLRTILRTKLFGRAACGPLLLLAVVASDATAATYEPEPTGFCREQTVHDFLEPFERMPKLNGLLPDGTIPFGSPTLRVKFRNRLLLQDQYVGYGIHLRRIRELPLFWHLRTTLTRVDWKGRPAETIKTSDKRVGIVYKHHGFGFTHWMGEEPLGAYRVSTVVYNRHGRRIGGFGSYFRVVKPTVRPRLGLASSSVRPGGTVFARYENFGTASFETGYGLRLQRFDGSSWVPVPSGPAEPDHLEHPDPGATTRCTALDIPVTTPSGRYRISGEWSLLSPGGDYEGPDRGRVTAEFTILP